MDEPGEDSMCYWSENHQLIFGTIELLAGQFYSDKVFYNLPITGRERMERAKKRLLDWFKYRYKYGFIEWHSNTYYEEDVAPLSLLIDFSEDEEIRLKHQCSWIWFCSIWPSIIIKGILLQQAEDATKNKKDPNRQDVLDIMKKAFGIGPVREYDYTRLSAEFVLNKKYRVPEVLIDIARSKEKFILKESLGLDLSEVREK